jgi:hypothetical protein
VSSATKGARPSPFVSQQSEFVTVTHQLRRRPGPHQRVQRGMALVEPPPVSWPRHAVFGKGSNLYDEDGRAVLERSSYPRFLKGLIDPLHDARDAVVFVEESCVNGQSPAVAKNER